MIVNQSSSNIKYTKPDESVSEKEFESNFVYSYFINNDVTLVKTSNKAFIECGEIATQTIVITNNSDIKILSPKFTDYLTGSAQYIEGSVIVNNISKPDFDVKEGFILDDIDSKGSTTIQYQIKATTDAIGKTIENYGKIDYKIDDPTQAEEEFESISNTLQLDYLCCKLEITKSVDKKYIKSGDILTYTSILSNTGNTPTTELVFTDIIPEGTTFVENSLFMDGIPIAKNPNDGVKIANLGSGQKTTLVFKVTVN